jgi:hypothetical protein
VSRQASRYIERCCSKVLIELDGFMMQFDFIRNGGQNHVW